MSGWSVDIQGVDMLLGEVDEQTARLDRDVTDALDGYEGCAAALSGQVGFAFSQFALYRREAPAEVALMIDGAASALIGSAAALEAGSFEQAEAMRYSRVVAAGSWLAPQEAHPGVATAW